MNNGAMILIYAGTQIKFSDMAVFLFFNRRLECKMLDRLMLLFTALGSLPVATALALVLLLFSRLELFGLGMDMAATLIIGQIGVQAAKRIVNRPRPYIATAEAHPKKPPACVYSFPSGHTCAAFCIALAIAHGLPSLAVPVYALAIMVGVSRIYLGVHYPSDVICGYAVACFAYWGQTFL